MAKMLGKLQSQVCLSRYVSWRTSGIAKQCYWASSISDLQNFMSQLKADEAIYWLGLGSNSLIRSGGLDATVIMTQGCLGEIEQLDSLTIKADAGLSCAKLARFAAKRGLGGLEFLASVPGTVGGALAMNAGCYGSEIWDFVDAVTVIDRNGELRSVQPDDFQIAYRKVQSSKEQWFTQGIFKLHPASSDEGLVKIRKFLQHRARTQPANVPTCGSVFRNPKDDYAARLIEACGLKGFTIAGAQVSTKHANFIVNLGDASAESIEQLIDHVAATVLQKMGVKLVREVRVIGDRV